MGGRQEAFDAEPMALRAGLQLIAERREEGASYTVFTDSQRRSKPGGFRDTAGRDHPLEGVHSEHQVDPRPQGVEGNDQADQHARGATEGRTLTGPEWRTVTLASLKRQRIEKAHQFWGEDIVKRKRAFTIREGLRKASKSIAARSTSWPAATR